MTKRNSLDAALAAIKKQWPNHKLKAALFNANSPFIMTPFLELKEEDVKPGVDVNLCVQSTLLSGSGSF